MWRWWKFAWCVSSLIGSFLAGAADRAAGANPAEMGLFVPADRVWQVGVTPSYSSGNFGTNSTSTFLYVPLSIRRMFRDGDVSVVFPFVTATTDGRSVLLGERANRVDQSGPSSGQESGSGDDDDDGGGSGAGAGSGTGGCSGGCGLTSRAAGQRSTTAGLGDIILRGRYYIVEERAVVPLIALTARMKLPTGSASQGLGTGAFDYGMGTAVSKMLTDSWIAMFDAGYNVIGSPDGLDLQNQHWYDVGAGYYVTKDLLGSVFFEEYRAIVPGFVNARDFLFSLYYRASDAWRFNSGLSMGVSNGAPDHGFSIGASHAF